MSALLLLVYALVAVCLALYGMLSWRYGYWSRRGVVHEPPVFLYGNMRGVRQTRCFRDPFYDFYTKYRRLVPYGGFYLFVRRAVVLFDLDLVKRVLIKDFANFATRGMYHNERDDPLTAHLFNLDGAQWRSLRAKLTPTFTSGKMKFMFPTIVQVAQRFAAVLREEAEGQSPATGVEMRELLARYGTDVIGTCAFGLECNSLRDPQTRFRQMGKKIFTAFRHKPIVMSLVQAYPDLAKRLGFKLISDDVHRFYTDLVADTVAYREREAVQRNDFMNLLIELRNTPDGGGSGGGLTLPQITAQAFVFFVAGFETSSSTMGFCLYELAMHQTLQERARAEVRDVLACHGDRLTYEAMHELKYLLQVVRETLRLYSIAAILLRRTIDDYAVPGTSQTIERGTVIVVPVDAIHRDPDIYPEPERFDPERFAPGEMEKRHAMAYLPFGDGPRNCIGMRFGEMQTLIGLATLLHHFRFSRAADTQVPLQFDKSNILLAPNDGIKLKVQPLGPDLDVDGGATELIL